MVPSRSRPDPPGGAPLGQASRTTGTLTPPVGLPIIVRPVRRCFPLLVLVALACEEGAPPDGVFPGSYDPSGSAGQGGEKPGEDRPPPRSIPEPEMAPDCPPADLRDPGPSLVRRLTRLEYDNAVRDLLGEEIGLASAFAAEEESLGFDNNARALQVAPLHAEQFMEAAETLGAKVRARFDELFACEVQDRACANAFVRHFGKRAWRRPLDEAEVASLLGAFDAAAELVDPSSAFLAGIEMVAQTIFQAPSFLYRIEVGEPVDGIPGLRRLTDYELAARLSFLVWRSIPDDALLAAAGEGALQDADALVSELHRLLADARAVDALFTFFEQWLDLDEVHKLEKDTRVYPEWGEPLREAFAAEARAFVNEVVWADGDLRGLYDADYTFVNQRLARLYELPEPDGDEWQRVPLPGERAGLLTQGALMAALSKPNQSSPIARGAFVRKRLLCQALPAPPPDVAATPPDPDPNLTTRERFLEHTANDQCSSCHTLIDPIGFGFERFDAIGRYRAVENGRPVDDSGELTEALDASGEFTGVAELAHNLAASEYAQRCVAKQAFRFAFGRGEIDEDGCAIDGIYETYADGGHGLPGLLEGIVRSDAFRFRRAEYDEPVEGLR